MEHFEISRIAKFRIPEYSHKKINCYFIFLLLNSKILISRKRLATVYKTLKIHGISRNSMLAQKY